nr:unnamed protein product [Spirometra erinaceieuropaei]
MSDEAKSQTRSSQISTALTTQRQRSTATDLSTLSADVRGTRRTHARNLEPILPSSSSSAYSIALTFAAAALVPTTPTHNPGAPSSFNRHTVNPNDVDSLNTCPHYDRTFASCIGLHLVQLTLEMLEPLPVPKNSSFGLVQPLGVGLWCLQVVWHQSTTMLRKVFLHSSFDVVLGRVSTCVKPRTLLFR